LFLLLAARDTGCPNCHGAVPVSACDGTPRSAAVRLRIFMPIDRV
jgi:hypothetical protein